MTDRTNHRSASFGDGGVGSYKVLTSARLQVLAHVVVGNDRASGPNTTLPAVLIAGPGWVKEAQLLSQDP